MTRHEIPSSGPLFDVATAQCDDCPEHTRHHLADVEEQDDGRWLCEAHRALAKQADALAELKKFLGKHIETSHKLQSRCGSDDVAIFNHYGRADGLSIALEAMERLGLGSRIRDQRE